MPKPSPSARKGSSNRIRLPQRPTVDKMTLKQLEAWQKTGVSLSVLMDRLVSHAKNTRFDPTNVNYL